MDWQTPLALICIMLAGSFVSRMVWRLMKGKSDGCASCPASKTPQSGEKTFVNLEDESRRP